ncbi:MAG: transaldolase [Moraxellaceae bacterium]|nr:transaldolase [Moraxellaceae bacterium]MDP1776454.1 transaldolase [Moraxellaceae bacterium]MDZ4297442.1 transaldolase [Moraxellaceae bacterium]MDZ4387411.1 transaldolase [Moraxellaceae bacterium]
MTNPLEQLTQHTTVVADTGDINSIQRLRPIDATTNPSLILKAASDSNYRHILDDGITLAQRLPASQRLQAAMESVAVGFGVEILRHIPGLVSTEVDARLSFDIPATLAQARRLIALYQARGIGRERVLIKIASTWEGIQAAKQLEQEGIHCNLTLLFCMAQAQAAADAGATLISPFVGRILDWHVQKTGQQYSAETDPGVVSVKAIYEHYKRNGYNTVVMGASFRNTGEIRALAGCDKLTISPALLDALANEEAALTPALHDDLPRNAEVVTPLSEAQFRWQLNADAMATEKLAEGIRLFAADIEKLETLLKQGLA